MPAWIGSTGRRGPVGVRIGASNRDDDGTQRTESWIRLPLFEVVTRSATAIPPEIADPAREVLYVNRIYANPHQPETKRVALLDELQLKRERENQEAERHRRRRDELNDKTREWVEKRDSLNAQVRALVDEATQHRIQRDELNAQVRVAKEERDKFNRRVNELQDQLTDLKRRRLPHGAVPLGKLQQELKRLEFKQMTSVLSVDKDRALIDEIRRLQNEVKRLEKSLEDNEDVRKLQAEAKAARDQAEDAHRRVSELAEKAQAEHDQMTTLYEKSDALRREADKAQEEFIKTKMLADEEHRKHIERIRQVHDYDKIIHGIWMKSRGVSESAAVEVDAKREAEMIFERFKKGEKLSTDDLLTLQKSGYL